MQPRSPSRKQSLGVKQSDPLWTKNCDVAIKNKKYAFHRMRSTRSITNIIFKRCRSKTRRIILEAKQYAWNKFCSSITSSSPLPGRRLNVSQAIVLGLKHNGISGTNDQHKHRANILANHFASITASNHTPKFTANQHRTLHTLHNAAREYIKPPEKHTSETLN